MDISTLTLIVLIGLFLLMLILVIYTGIASSATVRAMAKV